MATRVIRNRCTRQGEDLSWLVCSWLGGVWSSWIQSASLQRHHWVTIPSGTILAPIKSPQQLQVSKIGSALLAKRKSPHLFVKRWGLRFWPISWFFTIIRPRAPKPDKPLSYPPNHPWPSNPAQLTPLNAATTKPSLWTNVGVSFWKYLGKSSMGFSLYLPPRSLRISIMTSPRKRLGFSGAS